ncbi:hypothetical protein [Undibacterium sp.]|uniref:hypothetical protein n=1 Tax=Undibacterium sp. TaxID=1914977 RepID=UPI0037511B79
MHPTHDLNSNQINPSQRNFGIDLLRGFSILSVVIHHLAMSFRLPLQPSLAGECCGVRAVVIERCR